MSVYLQFGCGFDAPESWLNYDASPTLFFERIPFLGGLYTKNEKRFPKNVIWGDIAKGLPHQKGSVQGIFCSHILEHLCLEDCRQAIRNTYDYLSQGGIFRLVLPDLQQAIEQYTKNSNPEAARKFMETTLLGAVSRGSLAQRIMDSVFGNSKHQWMWDEKSLRHELEEAGFRKIRRAQFGDSKDPRFKEVERESRFIHALALEASK